MLSSALSLLAALTLLAPDADLVRSGGVLGATLTYDIDAAPATPFALGISTGNGPTPLALLDPGDPRVLDLGIDLLEFWALGQTGAAGEAQVVYPLPASPGLAGLTLHAQLVEMPLVPTTFGAISNLTTTTLGFPGTSALTFGDAYLNVVGHTATLLDDGRVLIAGGNSEPVDAVSSIGLYDPQTEAMPQSASSMGTPRYLHTATKLDDGRVLLVGGLDHNDDVVPIVEIYDPATDAVQPAAPLSKQRSLHTATKLPDGRVLVVGGAHTNDGDFLKVLESMEQTSELFDPATGTWSPGPLLPLPRGFHAASLLQDGRVLVTGGIEVIIFFGLPTPAVTDDCQIYDPATNAFTTAAKLPGARSLHAQTTLADGRVVIAGGADLTLLPLPSVTTLDTTAAYFPTVDAWISAASMNKTRAYATLIQHGDHLFAFGGIADVDVSSFDPLTPGEISVERADLGLLSWDGSMSLVKARLYGGAYTPMEGGSRVLVTGEADNGDPATHDTSCELFTP